MVSGFERISKRALPVATLAAALIALAAGVYMAAISPTSALAGEYHVYSCRTPSGESAPTEGWSGSVALGDENDDYATNSCSEGGSLIAALGDQAIHIAGKAHVIWSFETPAGDRLAGATLWRAAYLHGRPDEAGTYLYWLAGPANEDVIEACEYAETAPCPGIGDLVEPLSVANRLAILPANLGAHLEINVACEIPADASGDCGDDFGDPNGYAAVVYLYAADLILEQAVGPTASNVGGELASAATVGGTSDVSFDASDPGAGVYEAVFSVDGQVVQSTVVNENGGHCRNVGETTDGLPAFLYTQPCPASVNGDVGFETTRVGNGSHHLVVTVTDAAGNATTVLDRTITVDNPPPAQPPQPAVPNGTHASPGATLTVAWKGVKGRRLSSPYGRTHTVVGTLTAPGGVPIAGARIAVAATPAYEGAGETAMASPLTGPDGRFTVELPAGVCSRTLRFSYSSTVGLAPVATQTLTLSVRAGVSLRIVPRTASVGRSIYFSGRLEGGPVPRGGKPLVLEARSPGGGWLEFDVVHSNSAGRYHASYTFKFPGPAEYQFRVLCEAEADYPFTTGSSQVLGVFER
jgi:hypothetical protein